MSIPKVIPPEMGEELRLRPPLRSGRVIIKVDRRNCGAAAFSMGTQDLPTGGRIPVHRHEVQQEILFFHHGEGHVVLGEERLAVEPGSTVYVPAGVWHGIECGPDGPMTLVWFVSPPGLEDMFREIGRPPGVEPEPLSESEFHEIVRRHGMRLGETDGGKPPGKG